MTGELLALSAQKQVGIPLADVRSHERGLGTRVVSFCSDTSCGSPPAVENAFVQNNMARYSSGDTVRYACKNSLDLFGNAEVSCLNGTWTDPPQCKGRVSVPVPRLCAKYLEWAPGSSAAAQPPLIG